MWNKWGWRLTQIKQHTHTHTHTHTHRYTNTVCVQTAGINSQVSQLIHKHTHTHFLLISWRLLCEGRWTLLKHSHVFCLLLINYKTHTRTHTHMQTVQNVPLLHTNTVYWMSSSLCPHVLGVTCHCLKLCRELPPHQIVCVCVCVRLCMMRSGRRNCGNKRPTHTHTYTCAHTHSAI